MYIDIQRIEVKYELSNVNVSFEFIALLSYFIVTEKDHKSGALLKQKILSIENFFPLE